MSVTKAPLQTSLREVSLRLGRQADADSADLTPPTGAGARHRHQWRVVAIEQDAFGRVAMRTCDCGLLHFVDAA